MLPLVTGVQEIRAAKQLLEECKQELAAQGIAYDDNIQVGIMIETPAAALIADLLAKESAFFSIDAIIGNKQFQPMHQLDISLLPNPFMP